MSEPMETQAATPEEDAKIGEIPAIFVNKLYLSKVAAGAKITFAETFQVSGKSVAQPRVAVFLQHQDVIALHQLLQTAVKNIEVVRAAPAESHTDG